jgi:hypothetical protein
LRGSGVRRYVEQLAERHVERVSQAKQPDHVDPMAAAFDQAHEAA